MSGYIFQVAQKAHTVPDVRGSVGVNMEENVITSQEAVHARPDGEGCFVRNHVQMATTVSIVRYD